MTKRDEKTLSQSVIYGILVMSKCDTKTKRPVSKNIADERLDKLTEAIDRNTGVMLHLSLKMEKAADALTKLINKCEEEVNDE